MDTIFGGITTKATRRTDRGRKKKFRRMSRAYTSDGWSRKRAGVGLRPQRRPAKCGLAQSLRDEGL